MPFNEPQRNEWVFLLTSIKTFGSKRKKEQKFQLNCHEIPGELKNMKIQKLSARHVFDENKVPENENAKKKGEKKD